MADYGNNKHFDYVQAENYLKFAIQFTPQYGDSFIEMLKLYILTNLEYVAFFRDELLW